MLIDEGEACATVHLAPNDCPADRDSDAGRPNGILPSRILQYVKASVVVIEKIHLVPSAICSKPVRATPHRPLGLVPFSVSSPQSRGGLFAPLGLLLGAHVRFCEAALNYIHPADILFAHVLAIADMLFRYSGQKRSFP
jgi:hypothetical protein